MIRENRIRKRVSNKTSKIPPPHKIPTYTMISISCWKIDLIILFTLILQLKKPTEKKVTEEDSHGRGMVNAQVQGFHPLPPQQQDCHSGFLLTAICDKFYRQPAVIQASLYYRILHFHILLLPFTCCCIIFYLLTSQACLTLSAGL